MGRWQLTLGKNPVGFYREEPGEMGRHAALGTQLARERAKGLGTEKARSYIKKLSEMLELDETQSEIVLWYFLRHHYLMQLSSRTKDQTFRFGPEEDMTEVFVFYNLERVSSLKGASALFRIALDANHKHQKLASAAIKKLIEAGLFNNTVNLYRKLASARVPDVLSDNLKALWVHRNVEEQVACLELLFLVLYQEEQFSPSHFEELVVLFEEQAFGVHQLNRSHLNADTREAVVTIGNLSVLALLTCLNLESLLQDERAQEFINSTLFPENDSQKNVRLLSLINQRLMQWGRIHHQGPIMLAWAVFHCRVEQVVSACPSLQQRLNEDHTVREYLASVPFQNFAATSFSIHVMKFLTRCSSSLSSGSEHNLIGYLSVLKQLLSCTLTAFDIKMIPNTEDFVSFACCLFSDQPALCAQFWAWDANHPARGSLLRLAESRFPYDSTSWLKLLRALACEPDAAIHVLNSVQALKTFTQILPLPMKCGKVDCMRPAKLELTLRHQEGESWVCCEEHLGAMTELIGGRVSSSASNLTIAPLTVSLDGIQFQSDQTHLSAKVSINFPDDQVRIASGTHGELVSHFTNSMNQTCHVVQWQGVASGWLYLIRQLEAFLKPRSSAAPTQASVDRVANILALIARLLKTNDRVSRALPLYIKELVSEGPPPNLLSILFHIVEVAPLLPSALLVRKMATRALRCIAGFAQTFPADVWTQFSRRSILESTRMYGDDRVSGASGGAIRRLLQREELPQGRYSITLAFLDLLQAVLSHILQWSLLEDQTQHHVNPQEFLRCLRYVRSDVLSSYYSWKFVRVSERWEMGIQILSILRQVLTDVRPMREPVDAEGKSTPSLQQSVMLSLAGDSSFHHVLLSVAGIGHDILLKKSELGQFSDRQTLEQLVICGLTLLEQMLESSAPLIDALLTKTVRTGRCDVTFLVLIIAQYVHYPHATKIPLLAVRVLTRLCNINGSKGKGPPPILGYLGDAASDIRQSLLELLATSSDPEVRIAILRLIGAAVENQPGLAETLLTSPEESSSSSSSTTASTSGGNGGTNKKSAVQIIMHMLSRRALYENHPRLLSEALALLHSLWSRATNHTSILHSIRKEGSKEFWSTITQCLDLDRADTQDRWADIFHKNLATHFETKNDLSVPLVQTTPEQQKDIVRYCYNVLLHSIVLRILALECYYASDSLDDELKVLLTKMRDSMQVRWFNEYTRFFFPSMKRRLESCLKEIGVDPVVLTTSFRATRAYGDSYVYDGHLFKQKFSLQLANPKVERARMLLVEANNQLSVADAQIVLLESWKTLLQVGVSKIPGKLIDASRGPEMGVRLIHGFQNKVDSRLRILRGLDPHENTYLLEVVLADLLDIGQHFTRVYLEPLLLGDQKMLSYLVRVYCQLFRYEVMSLDRLQQQQAARRSNARGGPGGGDFNAKRQKKPLVLDATMEEMLRVKRAILTTILSVLLLFIHHQPEVFDRCVKDTEPGNEAEVRAVWKVVFTDVLSLVPSVFQTCVQLDDDLVAGEGARMLTSISMALVTAILRNINSGAGSEYLLYADFGKSEFITRIVGALGSMLDHPDLSGAAENGTRFETAEQTAARNQLLAMLELLLQVCLAVAGQIETAVLLQESSFMKILCDGHKTFFRTLKEEVDAPVFNFTDTYMAGMNNGAQDGGVGRVDLIGYLRVWCLMVSVVNRLLESSSDFAQPTMVFAEAHKARMVKVLTCALHPPFVLTLATVQEARRTCQLLYGLSCHMASWKLFDIKTALQLEKATLSFITQCSFLLGRAETLAQYCRSGKSLDGPLVMDDVDDLRQRRNAQKNNAIRNSRNLRSSLAASAASLYNYENCPMTGLTFSERIQCELFDALRTCLSFCRHDSPTLWKMSQDDSPIRLVPIFRSGVVRPVSMNDVASLGTLDLVLSTLTSQLSDYFGKAASGLNYRDVNIMSVSRIESSMGLSMLDSSDPPPPSASNSSDSKSEKKQHIFLRACHVLLNSIEETLFLIIGHCQFFVTTENAESQRQEEMLHNNSKYHSMTQNASLGNMTKMQISQDFQHSRRHDVSHHSSRDVSSVFNSTQITLKISDELAGSILRTLSKLDKSIENRLMSSPAEERELLQEKKVFLDYCTKFFYNNE
jgi:hypothetical protein